MVPIDKRFLLGAGLVLTQVGSMLLPVATEAQVPGAPPAIGDVQRHIRSISPFTGPNGTQVTVSAHGLRPNQNYQVAIGEMQGCGYQVCASVRTNPRGDLVTTVEVPEWAHTEHYEVVMILGEDFVPVAVSDPFHVSDADGFVQRDGVIGVAWPGCASLVGDHGVTYALVGPKARTLLASEGHAMIITGRIVAATCTQQYAIEVESMELAPERR